MRIINSPRGVYARVLFLVNGVRMYVLGHLRMLLSRSFTHNPITRTSGIHHQSRPYHRSTHCSGHMTG